MKQSRTIYKHLIVYIDCINFNHRDFNFPCEGDVVFVDVLFGIDFTNRYCTDI